MTSAAGPVFVATALKLYFDLPDTPRRASSYDQAAARSLFEREVPLEVVESALLLGSLRRLRRPAGALPLSPVRSLAYFSPVIDEILQLPLPPAFHAHLRHQANEIIRPVQESTFPDDRKQAAARAARVAESDRSELQLVAMRALGASGQACAVASRRR